MAERRESRDRPAVLDEVDSLVASWQAERPALDVGSVSISVPLRRVMQHAEARRAEVLRAHAMTPAIFDLLVALRRTGPPYVRTPSDLAHQLVLSAGGVSQRLERLEQSGLIERTVNTEDRRVVYVKLTEKAVAALDDLLGEYMEQEESFLHSLTERERKDLARLLARLDESISSALPPDPPPASRP